MELWLIDDKNLSTLGTTPLDIVKKENHNNTVSNFSKWRLHFLICSLPQKGTVIKEALIRALPIKSYSDVMAI